MCGVVLSECDCATSVPVQIAFELEQLDIHERENLIYATECENCSLSYDSSCLNFENKMIELKKALDEGNFSTLDLKHSELEEVKTLMNTSPLEVCDAFDPFT